MNPTIQQLDRWLDAHNMEATVYDYGVDIILRDNGNDDTISHHIQWRAPKGSTITKEEGLREACSIMARDCCLVPPLVALHLNHSLSSGAGVAGPETNKA